MICNSKQVFDSVEPFYPESVRMLASVLMPTEKQTLFLRACLHQGESGQQAFQLWQKLIEDPIEYFGADDAGIKRLLPLFYETVRNNRLTVEQKFLTYLRAARFTEEIRFDAYSKACTNVLDILNSAGVNYLLLKGAAYAELFYKIPSLRHSDDLDLLLCEKDLFKAAEILIEAGLKPHAYPLDIGTHHLSKIYHSSGLTVELHRRLYDPYCYLIPFEELWRLSCSTMILGRNAQVLGPEDSLLNILTHATLCTSQRSLRWVCDAWYLVKKYKDFDWNLFVNRVFYSKTELPVSFTLGYMVGRLQLPVPDWVLPLLYKRTHLASFKQRCAFIYGVRNNYPKQFSAILHMPAGTGMKIHQLLWLYFTFLLTLPLTGGMRIPALTPFYYILRIGKVVMRRLQA